MRLFGVRVTSHRNESLLQGGEGVSSWRAGVEYRYPKNTSQKNLTFFLAYGGKYLFLIELLTLNSNM
jgi:hypothetical protein